MGADLVFCDGSQFKTPRPRKKSSKNHIKEGHETFTFPQQTKQTDNSPNNAVNCLPMDLPKTNNYNDDDTGTDTSDSHISGVPLLDNKEMDELNGMISAVNDSSTSSMSDNSHIESSYNQTAAISVTSQTASFSDKYMKLEKLGIPGQYGTTFECKRISDGKYFAVKCIEKNRYNLLPTNHQNTYLKSLKNEIKCLRALQDHDNIIKLEDVFEDDSILYIVMERCIGGELLGRICKKQRYSEHDAKGIIKQILSAIRYMHDDKGIVHCDIKPDNILFVNKREDSPIKIIDFGMSEILPRLQCISSLCGTPCFMAPEVIRKQNHNHSRDMWSIGILLFVMIYGYYPFDTERTNCGKEQQCMIVYGKIVNGFIPKIKSTKKYGYGPWFPDHVETTKEVRDLISKLLEKDVSQRYTAKEALTHPWFINESNNYQINDDIESIMVSRLVGFNRHCPFKVVISTLFRNLFYKKRYEHFNQLKQLFTKYDTNNDNVLYFEEFKAMIDDINGINIDKQYINKIYLQLTTSGERGIEFVDLLNALVYDYIISSDDRLYDAFRRLDYDNDGKISINELKQRLQQNNDLRAYGVEIEQIKKECIDTNGVIDYEEFKCQLHPNFESTPCWIPNLIKFE